MMAQIAKRGSESAEIAFLFNEAQKKLGRTIGYDSQSSLLMIHDAYGLPVEVILMLIDYCVSIGKTGVNYITSTAKNWGEKEIDSIDVTKDVKDCLETFYGDVRIPLNKLYNVAAKDTFKVTLCITTPDGYTLKQVITEKNAENRHTSFGNTFQIFDQNGYLKVNAYPMY